MKEYPTYELVRAFCPHEDVCMYVNVIELY